MQEKNEHNRLRLVENQEVIEKNKNFLLEFIDKIRNKLSGINSVEKAKIKDIATRHDVKVSNLKLNESSIEIYSANLIIEILTKYSEFHNIDEAIEAKFELMKFVDKNKIENCLKKICLDMVKGLNQINSALYIKKYLIDNKRMEYQIEKEIVEFNERLIESGNYKNALKITRSGIIEYIKHNKVVLGKYEIPNFETTLLFYIEEEKNGLIKNILSDMQLSEVDLSQEDLNTFLQTFKNANINIFSDGADKKNLSKGFIYINKEEIIRAMEKGSILLKKENGIYSIRIKRKDMFRVVE